MSPAGKLEFVTHLLEGDEETGPLITFEQARDLMMYTWYDYDYKDQIRSIVCTHDFPDTGLQRSWCKFCNVTGQFNWIIGKYEEVKKWTII